MLYTVLHIYVYKSIIFAIFVIDDIRWHGKADFSKDRTQQRGPKHCKGKPCFWYLTPHAIKCVHLELRLKLIVSKFEKKVR